MVMYIKDKYRLFFFNNAMRQFQAFVEFIIALNKQKFYLNNIKKKTVKYIFSVENIEKKSTAVFFT